MAKSNLMSNAGSRNPPGTREGSGTPEEAKRNLLKTPGTSPKTVDAYEYLLDKHLFKTTTKILQRPTHK